MIFVTYICQRIKFKEHHLQKLQTNNRDVESVLMV